MQIKTNVKAGGSFYQRCETVSSQPHLADVGTDELQTVEGGFWGMGAGYAKLYQQYYATESTTDMMARKLKEANF